MYKRRTSPRYDRNSNNDSHRRKVSHRCQSSDRYERSKSPHKPEPICHGCGVTGHYIAKCPDAPDRCTACKGLYHTIDECPVEIRKTRPISKKSTGHRRRDDRSKDNRKSRKSSLHLSKRETDDSGSESSDSEN